VCLQTVLPERNSRGASPPSAAAASALGRCSTGGSSARTVVALCRPTPSTDSSSSASAASRGSAAMTAWAWAWTRSASLESSRMTRAIDWRAAGVRLGASSRFFWAADQGRQRADLRGRWAPGAGPAIPGELGDHPGVGRVRLVPLAGRLGVRPDPRRVGHADEPAGVGEEGGDRLGVGAGGLRAEVDGAAAGVPVGPGEQRGVPLRVVGQPLPAGRAGWPEQAGVEGVLRHVDPGEVGGGAGGAHGVPPLWLTNAGSGPELASEVEGAGGRAAIWFPGSSPIRGMRLIRPPGLAPDMASR